MVKVLGVFQEEARGEIGDGATQRATTSSLRWFALQRDNAHAVLNALDVNGFPSAICKQVTLGELLTGYMPDLEHYTRVLVPVMRVMHEKLRKHQDGVISLEQEEQAIWNALTQNGDSASHTFEGRTEYVAQLLVDALDITTLFKHYKQHVNTESIKARKEGHHDNALQMNSSLLSTTPHDSHIFFNMARIHFDKKDYPSCRNYLKRALENQPEFKEARQFLQYLEKKSFVESDEPRVQLRYRLHTPQPCLVTYEAKGRQAVVLDISTGGLRLRFQTVEQAPRVGAQVTVRSTTALLAKLLPDCAATIVWGKEDLRGLRFGTPLERDSRSFMRLAAYAAIV